MTNTCQADEEFGQYGKLNIGNDFRRKRAAGPQAAIKKATL
jgi:hypothetical protein